MKQLLEDHFEKTVSTKIWNLQKIEPHALAFESDTLQKGKTILNPIRELIYTC